MNQEEQDIMYTNNLIEESFQQEEDFKKWLIEKANYDNKCKILTENELLLTLIQAMFVINRERGYFRVSIGQECIHVGHDEDDGKYFYPSEYNNSEIQALEKALEYIWEHEK